jgi:hypothetical protein
MADIPPTRASLLGRLRDPRDGAAWTEFVALYGLLIYSFAEVPHHGGAVPGGGQRNGKDFLPGTDNEIRLWDLTAPADEPTVPLQGQTRGRLVRTAMVFFLATMVSFGVWVFLRHRRTPKSAPTASLPGTAQGPGDFD